MKRIDLVKSMAAEELAWEFMVFRFDAYCKAKGGESTLPDSQQGILEWLHQEVEELNPVEKILKAKADWYRSLAPLPASVKSALLAGNWDEPKSITRPELPEPETVTYGGYVEVTELLALPDEVLIPFLTDIQELCKRLNSYKHFANRFLKEE